MLTIIKSSADGERESKVMNNISIELWVSIGINLLALAFFAGVFFQTQKQLKDAIEKIEAGFEKKIQELKDDFTEKLKGLEQKFHDKFESVEKKQDKHNNLIERMVLCEASTKSAHKRIDDLKGEINV